MRITQRNYYGKAFVPGYAPKCDDKQTCELIVKLTERLAALEDMLYDGAPSQEAILQVIKKEGNIE